MDLKWTTGDIRSLERKMRLSLGNMIDLGTIDIVIKLLSLGMGITEEKAEEEYDKMIAEGSDSQLIFLEIQDALVDQGFLSRMIDLKKIIAGMKAKDLQKVADSTQEIEEQIGDVKKEK